MSLLLILYRTVIVNNYNAFEMMIMIMSLMMMMMMASLMALGCVKSLSNGQFKWEQNGWVLVIGIQQSPQTQNIICSFPSAA